MATKTFISAEEYLALPEMENGVEYELSNGELIVVPSPTFFHNSIRDEILLRIQLFLRKHPHLGKVIAEVDFWLNSTTARRPDIAFISARKLAALDPHKQIKFAPDLAIEIASPHDDLPKKIQDYLAAGTRVWALYPEAGVARIHKPGEPPVVRDAEAGDSLEDPELLPGLKIPLAEIFSQS